MMLINTAMEEHDIAKANACLQRVAVDSPRRSEALARAGLSHRSTAPQRQGNAMRRDAP